MAVYVAISFTFSVPTKLFESALTKLGTGATPVPVKPASTRLRLPIVTFPVFLTL